MTIRERVRAELDKVDDEYLGVVERMLEALERPSDQERTRESWSEFLSSTYGSMADAPIERRKPGEIGARGLAR